MLARVESDEVIDSTSKLVAAIGALLFGKFGREKRPSTLARTYVLLAGEEGTRIQGARRTVDIALDTSRWPGGGLGRPKPSVPVEFKSAAKTTGESARFAVEKLSTSLGPASNTKKGRPAPAIPETYVRVASGTAETTKGAVSALGTSFGAALPRHALRAPAQHESRRMSAETTGFNHVLLGRPRRLDRHGILAFLRSVALDRRGMLELRRIARRGAASHVDPHIRDELVIEQLAERYLRGSLSLVHVRPRDVGIELEGFLIEGAEATPLTGPTNEAGDLRPAPEVPPSIPCSRASSPIRSSTPRSKLVAKLGELLFGAFGLQKRPSTLARESSCSSPPTRRAA